MPKPQTTERFQVSCDVEAPQLGDVIAMFTRLGLSNISYTLITDVRTFNKNRKNEEPNTTVIASNGTAIDVLTPWLKDHPTFRARDAVKYCEAHGLGGGGAYYALRMLVEKKVLKKLSEGNYTRTDVKHLAAPKKKAEKKAEKKAKRVHDVTHYEFILRLMRRNHGRISFPNIKKHFENDGRNTASIHPTIAELVAKQQLKKLGDGLYELVKTETKPNGQDAVTEVSHG